MPKRKRNQQHDETFHLSSSHHSQCRRINTRQSTRRSSHLSSLNELFSHIKLFTSKQRVTLTIEDLQRTKPGQYLSDAMLDYEFHKLRHSACNSGGRQCLQNQNTFIADCSLWNILERSPDASLRVAKRFWRDTRLSEARYWLIPVHRVNHWSLALIHVHDLDFAWGKKSEGNAIVMCDSLSDNFQYAGIGRSLRAFVDARLRQELLVDNNHTSSTVSTTTPQHAWSNLSPHNSNRISGKEFPVKHAKLPQQENSTDCGLYVIQYIEEFLKSDSSVLPLFNNRNLFSSDAIVSRRAAMRQEYMQMLDNLRMEHPVIVALVEKLILADGEYVEGESAAAETSTLEQQLRELMIEKGWIQAKKPEMPLDDGTPLISHVNEDGVIVLD
mmetsp:Transcript_4578/g.17301  ORF Transcript_4578/g.17301 Transcript_4578/m.17301 type:complete len:385 (+) Transcript_4578:1729-2883(+)